MRRTTNQDMTVGAATQMAVSYTPDNRVPDIFTQADYTVGERTMDKLVVVSWIDSICHEGTWCHYDSAINMKPPQIVTAGFLIEENDGHIVLVQGYDPEDDRGTVLNAIVIPQSAVQKIQIVRNPLREVSNGD